MKNGFLKRIIGGICLVSMLFSFFVPAPTHATSESASSGTVIEASDIPLRLHYDEEAPYGNEGASEANGITAQDGWERWSLPIGNGYFGANVFGRTETERIQITEKTLSNPYYRISPEGQNISLGGLNNFSETYIDVGHPFASVTDYERYLDLKTAISGVSYTYEGVHYTREYFTSYPDKALVIRLDASEEGALNFVLRPTVPWKQEYASWEGDGASKTGQVISYIDSNDGIVELSGKMGYFDVDFLGIYRVITNGGEISATTCTNEYGETDGTITVSGATNAYIYVTLGSDYELTSEIFTTSDKEKPTFDTTLEDARIKVEGEAKAIADQLEGKSFEDGYAVLKSNHLADYTELFGRVSIDLGDSEDADLTTDELLNKYRSGEYSRYLEALYFQYGRYLLIECSRSGALPLNLQGTWNRYNKSPWGSGMWHNINEQMSYWHAFSTNLAETFEAYVEYNAAYMPAAEMYTTDIVKKYNPSQLDMDGGNGWSIGTGSFPYYISGDRSPGNLGFTTQLFWEYYQYTKDKALLEQLVFPILVSAARYVVKAVKLDEEGHYLVSHADSPEMFVNGVWHYTSGTTYAQTFAYLNNYNALLAAKELGIDLSDSELLSTEELCVFERVMEQLDKYDPIIVGLSGQIKEFREEDYYCSIGDEPNHRHISQLVGLYPGDIINSNTPAWLDAAKVTLTERGDQATGWGIAHRLNLWARTKDGDRTYTLLNRLLYSSTATNLWDLCPPFVIDGNFGGAAGISEMLLQSHEGYIAPLAAIPTAWDSGSYTGLVARGNFEVSAEWKNGTATCFNITSKAGGEASVSYGGITSARVVRASDGRAVNYTVSGTDRITFATEVGETYIISGFKLTERLPAPTALNVNRSGLGEILLTWDEVAGAVGYNVYVAVESQPDYTLLGATAETGAVYIPKPENINARTTFKVIPFNSYGVEGHGVIAYQNPVETNATVNDYEAYAYENGELQVTVKATENAQSYKLWKKAEGETEYTLLTESPYPIIIHDNYIETDSYAISIVSKYQRIESELYALSNIKNATAGSDRNAAAWKTNVFAGNIFEADADAISLLYNNSYGYSKLTDGIFAKDASGKKDVHLGRFATQVVSNSYLDGTIWFDNTHLVSELRIYDFDESAASTRMGDQITIYALSGGEWKEIASISGRNNIIAARQYDSSQKLYYLPLDLGSVICEAVRVHMSDSSSAGITVYEITCSGASLPGELSYSDNLLLGASPSRFESVGVFNSDYSESKLTDGSFDSKQGRFALKAISNNNMTIEYTLGGNCILNNLKIYDFAEKSETVSRVSRATVELYINGEWVKYYDALPLLAPNARLSGDYGRKYTQIEFNGANASKIRISMENTLSSLGISIYEIELSGFGKQRISADNNILSGKEFVPNPDATGVFSEQFGYSKLTDGIYHRDASGKLNYNLGRFATKVEANACLDGTVQLNGVYLLSEMRIYDYTEDTRLGDIVKVYAYYAEEWREVYSISGLSTISDARILDTELGLYYLPIDLSGARAEAIRVYSSLEPANAITLFEITCSGTKTFELADKNILASDTSATVNKVEYPTFTSTSNILLNKVFVANPDMTAVHAASFGIGKLTDGVFNKNPDGTNNWHLSRYSSKAETNPCFDATVTLDGTYLLGELRIYDYGRTASISRIGDQITVYALVAGDWKTIASYTSEADVLAARVMDSTYGLYYIPIDMSGIKATAIRICTRDANATDALSFFEITCSGVKLTDDNLIASSSALTDEQISAITDNDVTTAFNIGIDVSGYYLEFDFGKDRGIYTLNIRDVRYETDLVEGNVATRSNDTFIDLYINGEWVRVIGGASLSTTEDFTSFNLYGLIASKIRIGFNNTQVFDNGEAPAAVISEIYLSVSRSAADKKPLLNAYAALPIIADADEAYIAKMNKFKAMLTEFMLTDEDVTQYASEMIAYNATLLDGAHTAHSIKTYEAKAPTCTESGWYAYEKCEHCDYTTYETILPTTHDISDEWHYNSEQHWKSCANDTDERLEAGAHIFENGCDTDCDCGYTRTAFHTYDGAKDAECNVCGDVREIVETGFVMNVNLTLTSEISLNFYTPTDGNVLGIAIDGVALTCEGTVNMDGVTYDAYRYLGIAPSRAMEAHTVTITYTKDGETLTREVEYSALIYAKSLLSNTTISEEGKAIVRDMLGFAKASYDYFGNENATEEEVELLNTLTSQYPATKVESIPNIEGVDPSTVASVVKSAQLALDNGVIKMVLNIADTSKPLNVTINGKSAISLEANHGQAQVIVELRAYQLGEILTITSGDLSGTYCFNEYANAMMGDDSRLDALLLAMHAYSESAKNYRAENN